MGMSTTIKAQILQATRVDDAERRLDMTFVDTRGEEHTLSLPLAIASDLAPVLKSLTTAAQHRSRPQFTRLPKNLAVASAEHKRLVLVRFDDEPPYGLSVRDAEHLWRGLREEAQAISSAAVPLRQ
jgi:hypothetical protein